MPAQTGLPGVLALFLITVVGIDMGDTGTIESRAALQRASSPLAGNDCPPASSAQQQLRAVSGEADLVVSAVTRSPQTSEHSDSTLLCRYETRSRHGNDRHWLASAQVDAHGVHILQWNGPL